VEALHRIREPLQRSAWSVLCELVALDGVSAAPFGLPLSRKDTESTDAIVVDEITPAWLEEARQAVKRFTQLWHIRSEKDYPWWGFKGERYSQQVRDDAFNLMDKTRKAL